MRSSVTEKDGRRVLLSNRSPMWRYRSRVVNGILQAIIRANLCCIWFERQRPPHDVRIPSSQTPRIVITWDGQFDNIAHQIIARRAALCQTPRSSRSPEFVWRPSLEMMPRS